jgi:hypothetical protein
MRCMPSEFVVSKFDPLRSAVWVCAGWHEEINGGVEEVLVLTLLRFARRLTRKTDRVEPVRQMRSNIEDGLG